MDNDFDMSTAIPIRDDGFDISSSRPIGLLEQVKHDNERAIVEAEAKKAYADSQAANKNYDTIDSLGNAANAIGGAVRGAGSIGATLLWPIDASMDAIKGDREGSTSRNSERRASMDDGLASMGYNPESTSYKSGKVVTEIAGTAPIGGMLGGGARLLGASPKVVSALESGGFALNSPVATTWKAGAGDLALRAGAGGLLGASQSALIDPSTAEEGAMIGALLPASIKAAGSVGKAARGLLGGIASNSTGATTGAGTEAVKQAYNAGKNGYTEFLDNLRGKVDFGEIVVKVKQGLANMRTERQQAYRSGMTDISNDKSVIDFSPIDKAMQKVSGMGSYKGVKINSKSAETVDELSQVINQWKMLDPPEYHTPEGIDALKKSIGDIRESTQFGSPARRAADDVYHSVKNEITSQTPAYAKVMKDYQKSSEALTEIEKALSLGNKASQDTSVRKLQSLLRNNAQTNYGNRLTVANNLENQGGVELMPALAGQAMNSWMPRGMVGAMEKGALGLSAFVAPHALALAPFASPRIMGEVAYKLGSASGMAKKAAETIARRGLLSNPQLLSGTSLLMQTAPRVTLTSQARQR